MDGGEYCPRVSTRKHRKSTPSACHPPHCRPCDHVASCVNPDQPPTPAARTWFTAIATPAAAAAPAHPPARHPVVRGQDPAATKTSSPRRRGPSTPISPSASKPPLPIQPDQVLPTSHSPSQSSALSPLHFLHPLPLPHLTPPQTRYPCQPTPPRAPP